MAALSVVLIRLIDIVIGLIQQIGNRRSNLIDAACQVFQAEFIRTHGRMALQRFYMPWRIHRRFQRMCDALCHDVLYVEHYHLESDLPSLIGGVAIGVDLQLYYLKA